MKALFFLICTAIALNLGAQEVVTIRTNLPGYGTQTIRGTLENGNVMFQGDIDLGPYSPPSGRGGAELIGSVPELQNGGPWANATIPYEIVEGHPKRTVIRRAIDTLQARTNLRFVAKSSTHQDYVVFTIKPASDAGAASSGLGCKGGRQEIKVKGNIDISIGTIMHEIMHAAGIMHEQCRPDRDTYVTIDLTNVDTRATHNFDKCEFVSTESAYDFNSIMHYPATAFASSGNSITVKPAYASRLTGPIGQRTRLSPGDIATINRIYASGSAGTRTTTGAGSGAASGGRGGAADAAAGRSFDIRYNVQLVPQPTSMSCWAASAAMVYGWLRHVRINVDDIRNRVGVWRNFPAELVSGLQPNDTRIFRQLHFCCEAPMCYTVEGFVGLIESYGPIWVAGAVPGPHVRVVYGAYGDGTPTGTRLLVHDPWGSNLPTTREPTQAELAANRGQTYERTFAQFMSEMENLGSREIKTPGAVYVVHAPGPGGGACSCN
jgi:Astacin (Peptidase family M12A)/Papain-like cysteine protease AvrRpt2